MVPHTPVGAVAAGEVVCTNESARIAHLPIAAGERGALAAGGGLYEVTGLDANGIAEDTTVWWDNANNGVTQDTTSGDHQFGVTVTACAAGSGNTCVVRHDPSA